MKDVVELSTNAKQHINSLLKQSDKKAFVVSLDNRGCSGHSYVYTLCDETEISKFDERLPLEEGVFVVRAESVLRVLGSQLDYASNLLGNRFVWTNPQAVNACGCGKSVSF
jgi:iron-sulfur cluster assembly protein